jgi:N-acetylmuramoyl-L-alanine amidase
LSVTIIPAAEIRATGHRALGEALRRVSSASVTCDRNHTYVGVRGPTDLVAVDKSGNELQGNRARVQGRGFEEADAVRARHRCPRATGARLAAKRGLRHRHSATGIAPVAAAGTRVLSCARMKHGSRARKRAPAARSAAFAERARRAAVFLLALASLGTSGCALFPRRPPAPPRPAPGYERLRDTLATVDASGLAGRRIALDPGHGGFFRGALGVHGLTEAEANLGVALRLRDLLAAHGALVFLTRETDRDFLTPADSSLRIDLAERARLAGSFAPDLFLAIHHNADPRGAHDVNETQTYYKLGDEGPSLDAAQDVHRSLVRNVGIKANQVLPGNFHVLRTSEAPAILTETSYITNPDVEQRLRLADKQALEAEALFIGLAHYFARRVPVIEEFVAFWPFNPYGSPFNTAYPALHATMRGAWDRVWLTVDGRPVEPLVSGERLNWYPAKPLARGPHEARLRVALSGAGSSRERRLDFGVALALGSLQVSFPDQVIWDGRQPLGFQVRALDDAGSPYLDSLTVRVRTSGNVSLAPADTVVTVLGGSAWVYFQDGRILARTPGGGRPLEAPPSLGQLEVGVAEEPPTLVEGEPAPQYTARAGIPVGQEPAPPFRTAFALLMPAETPLRAAPGTTGPEPALEWINRDGFVRLPRDSSGAVHVPRLSGFRAWPADSTLPPRFVPIAGGALHGRRIVLDPEGGGNDAAGQGPGGTRAAFLNLESARILAGFLTAAGAEVRLTRDGDHALSDVERVERSEAFHADRFVRIAHRTSPPRLGYYFASAAGRAWAVRAAREFAALGLPAPTTGDEAQYVLQQTSSPALFASPSTLGSEADEARILAPGALRAEAYALFLALAREWAPDAAWPPDSLTVLDAAGRPVPGAAVTLGGALVLVTGPSGRVGFARTEPGPILVEVEDARARARGILLESQRGAVLTGSPGR